MDNNKIIKISIISIIIYFIFLGVFNLFKDIALILYMKLNNGAILLNILIALLALCILFLLYITFIKNKKIDNNKIYILIIILVIINSMVVLKNYFNFIDFEVYNTDKTLRLKYLYFREVQGIIEYSIQLLALLLFFFKSECCKKWTKVLKQD